MPPTSSTPPPMIAAPSPARRPSWGRCIGALALLSLALDLGGCVVHRGAWTRARPQDTSAAITRANTDAEGAPASAPALRILMIGDTGHLGRAGGAVAAALADRLDASRTAGAPAIVLWLGDNLAPARCDGAIAPRIAALADVVAEHLRAGGASYATVGEAEWACADPSPAGLAGQRQPAGAPWIAPAFNYVIRVGADGRSRPVSRCDGDAPVCVLEPRAAAEPPPLLELVVIDSAAWLAPPPLGTLLAAAADRSLAEQAALLTALRADPGVPRILVTHHPIESAGPHGQGGRWPDSAFYLHAEPLRAAIEDGVFIGVLSGHEHSVQVSGDLSPAIKRSSRAWIDAPIFALISGAAGRPDAWIGARSWRYFQGLSLAPAAISNHAGLAELTLRGDAFELALWARRAGRWRRAAITVPRARPPHPVETPSPGMEPCLQCDTVPRRE